MVIAAASTETAESRLLRAEGDKVRYRPSLQIKSPFAHVEATTSDIASVWARKGQTGHNPSLRDPPTLQATITTPLSTCGPLEQWLPAFMQKVATDNNLPLQSSTAESSLDTYKWRPIMAYDGGWTGKIVVQLTNYDRSIIHRRKKES